MRLICFLVSGSFPINSSYHSEPEIATKTELLCPVKLRGQNLYFTLAKVFPVFNINDIIGLNNKTK
jgi:hypothetical protein